jgi:hypothetical protein
MLTSVGPVDEKQTGSGCLGDGRAASVLGPVMGLLLPIGSHERQDAGQTLQPPTDNEGMAKKTRKVRKKGRGVGREVKEVRAASGRLKNATGGRIKGAGTVLAAKYGGSPALIGPSANPAVRSWEPRPGFKQAFTTLPR